MRGYANIFLAGEHEDQYGRKVHDYQFNCVLGGSSFARTLGEEKLHHFLGSGLGLAEDSVEQVKHDLAEAGRAVIPELDIAEHETGSLGLQQASTEL